MAVFIGLDIGGTNIIVAAADHETKQELILQRHKLLLFLMKEGTHRVSSLLVARAGLARSMRPSGYTVPHRLLGGVRLNPIIAKICEKLSF